MASIKTRIKTTAHLVFVLITFLIAGQGCGEAVHIGDGSSTFDPSAISFDSGLQSQALQIIQLQCSGCHSTNGQGGVSSITDVDHLIISGLITPGDSSQGRLIGSIEDSSMPTDAAMNASDLQTIKAWVDSATFDSGTGGGPPPATVQPTFQSLQQFVIVPKCLPCHRTAQADGGVNYETHALSRATGKIRPGEPLASDMYEACENGVLGSGANAMPPLDSAYSALSQEELTAVYDWIAGGALDN